MRLFAALALPAEVRADLAAWGRACAAQDAALRPVPAASVHLTLAFLGVQPAEAVAVVESVFEDALATARWPGAAELGGPLWLAPRRPHVLSVAVGDPDGALAELQAAVAAGLTATLGWEPEHRRYRPHVTVARLRRGDEVRRALPGPSPSGRLDPLALALMRSHLDPAGARYETLVSVAP